MSGFPLPLFLAPWKDPWKELVKDDPRYSAKICKFTTTVKKAERVKKDD